ncbi:MAG: sensor histidine kinase [Gemmatimonadota bacterium]
MRSLLGPVLESPLFHKILVANALVVALGAVAGTAISVHVGRTWTGASTLALAAGFAAVGLVLSLVVNGLLVGWLLDPLGRLERAAARIQEGADPEDEQVAVPAGADPGLRRLIDVFNGMLRSVARHRARLREVAARSQEAGEEERHELSTVLQDQTAQQVASCLVRLRWARGLEGAERDRALDELRDDLGDALESVRQTARSLRPPELDDLGLQQALRALARELREESGLRLGLDLTDVDPLLDPGDRPILYRAVEAAVRSSARDASPGRLELVLAEEDGAVVAEVRGADRGFRVPSPADDDPGHLTLFAVRERVRFSGGDLHLERTPEGRTAAVRIRMPVGGGGGTGDLRGGGPPRRSDQSPRPSHGSSPERHRKGPNP